MEEFNISFIDEGVRVEMDNGWIRVRFRRESGMVFTSRCTKAALDSRPFLYYIRFLLGDFDPLLKFGYLANGFCDVAVIWEFPFLVPDFADSDEVLPV